MNFHIGVIYSLYMLYNHLYIEDVNKNIKKVFLAGVAPEFRQEAYIIGLKLTLNRLAREVEFAQKDDCSSNPER